MVPLDVRRRMRAVRKRLSEILGDRVATSDPDERTLELYVQVAVLTRVLAELHSACAAEPDPEVLAVLCRSLDEEN